MVAAMRTKACSVPLMLAALAVLSCLFLVHGLYGLIDLFGGSPDLSPEAKLLIFAICFLVLAAAAAAGITTTRSGGGYRRALLLPREEAAAAAVAEAEVSVVSGVGKQAAVMPTTAVGMGSGEGEAAVAGEVSVEEEEEQMMRRIDMQTTQDYPGSGANSRHDPRNPH